MVSRISTKGQVVIPSAIRRLGLRPGDALHVKAEGERIVLTPQKKASAQQSQDCHRSGFRPPGRDLGPGAPVLTSKEVNEILTDFP